MSCSCCCYVSPSGQLLEGIRKERLVTDREEEAGAGSGEESRRNMDISLLREQYRCTKETQRRHTQVLLFRTVSAQLSEAVSIVPVTQGLTSPWQPNGGPLPALTFDPGPMSYDPWHVHLGLHRRLCPGVTAQLPASPLEAVGGITSCRRWSSSSDAVSSQVDVGSTSESLSSSRTTSPPHHTKELHNTDPSNRDPDPEASDRSRGDPDPEASDGSRGDPDPESSDGSKGDPDPESSDRFRGDPDPESYSRPVEKTCPNLASISEPDPGAGLKGAHPGGSCTSSEGSSTPVVSVSCSEGSSTTSTQEDLKETESRHLGPQTSSASAWRGSRKSMTPSLRLTRQLSVGGLGSSSMGAYQTQTYHPFPNRKTPRISEAAKRLGMYSSF